MEDEVLKAIIKANKLGAKGIQVVGYGIPATADSSPDYYLAIQFPPTLGAAGDTPWYDI